MFELDTTNSFTFVSNKISKVNYIILAGLRHSVPKHLKKSNCPHSEISLLLTIDNKEFDIFKKKSKDYYMLIKRIIAQCPKNSKHLCQDFSLTPVDLLRPGQRRLCCHLSRSLVWILRSKISVQSVTSHISKLSERAGAE